MLADVVLAGMTSIQQWFQDIIQPRFDTAEVPC